MKRALAGILALSFTMSTAALSAAQDRQPPTIVSKTQPLGEGTWFGVAAFAQRDGAWTATPSSMPGIGSPYRYQVPVVPGIALQVGAPLGRKWSIRANLDLPFANQHTADSTFTGPSVNVPRAVIGHTHHVTTQRIPTISVMFALRRHWNRVEPAVLLGAGVAMKSWTLKNRYSEYAGASGEIVRRTDASDIKDVRTGPVLPMGLEIAVRGGSRVAIVPYSTLFMMVPPILDYGSPFTWRAGVATRIDLRLRQDH